MQSVSQCEGYERKAIGPLPSGSARSRIAERSAAPTWQRGYKAALDSQLCSLLPIQHLMHSRNAQDGPKDDKEETAVHRSNTRLATASDSCPARDQSEGTPSNRLS